MQNDPGFQSRSIYLDETRPVRVSKNPKRRNSWIGLPGRVSLRILRNMWRKLATPRTRGGWILFFGKVSGSLILVLGILLGTLWFSLPNIDDPLTLFPSQSTVILDRNGVELYRLFSNQDRTYVQGEQISDRIKKATIAIEDERFLARSACFDVIGFSRAVLSQLAPRYFVRSGGSTLTQQFAGNALVGRERSVLRKMRELMLSCQLERRYNKDQLLELYLNWIPYGHNAYGIEQAARNYFGTGANSVSLAQSAVLAALPQRPSYFNPYGPHRLTTLSDAAWRQVVAGKFTAASDVPGDAVTIGLIGQRFGSGSATIYIGGRTDQVLKNMTDQGMITSGEREQALKELQKIMFSPERRNIRAPHFVLWVQKEVEGLLGIDASDPTHGDRILEQGGFRITTTLDWNLQQAAEKVVATHRDDIKKRFGANNLALVSVSPVTHEIVAYVGNTDFSDDTSEGKIDMARSPRQPGSSFKAFTYLAAFEQGYGPGSVIYDVPTKFGEDQPQNFDGSFWGVTSMRAALGGSRNIPAIKAFFLGGGEEPLLSLAARIGVPSPLDQKNDLRKQNPSFDYGWPLAIGAAEVPLTEMVQGYATIADQGNFRPLRNILKITDKDGNIRYLPKEEPARQVLDERIAAQVTSVLSDAGARPNDYWRTILSVPGFDAAAKTGTSNKCLERDTKKNCTIRRPESTWTIGYTPSLITGVWVGNATSQSLFEKADGLTTAAPIWHDFMVEAHRKLKNTSAAFRAPSRLTHPLLSRLSGQLASGCTPIDLRAPDVFLEERTPALDDPACVLVNVDKLTGLLSSPVCPADAVEQRPFFVPKSELPDRWPLWEQGVQEWAMRQMAIWEATEHHSGSLLPLPLAPTKECDPSLTPGRLNKPEVQLVSPSAGESVSFPVFTPTFNVTSVAPIREVSFTVDGKQAGSFLESPFSGPIRVHRSISTQGTHVLSVTVTDIYFNTASDSVSIGFGARQGSSAPASSADASSPIRLTEPKDGVFVPRGSVLTIRAEAEDSSSLAFVQFSMDGSPISTKLAAPFEVLYPINVAPGPHTVKVLFRDNAGRESEDSVTITVSRP